jgi:hypothetical protein
VNNPGYKSLGVFNIGATGTETGDWVENLEGMLSCLFDIRMSYGASSGTPSVRAYLQTTGDEGTTVCDIACVLFEAASEHKMLNFSALTPKLSQVTPTDASLADDTAVDGILGNKLRLKVVTIGTYSGSTQVIARANVR